MNAGTAERISLVRRISTVLNEVDDIKRVVELIKHDCPATGNVAHELSRAINDLNGALGALDSAGSRIGGASC